MEPRNLPCPCSLFGGLSRRGGGLTSIPTFCFVFNARLLPWPTLFRSYGCYYNPKTTDKSKSKVECAFRCRDKPMQENYSRSVVVLPVCLFLFLCYDGYYFLNRQVEMSRVDARKGSVEATERQRGAARESEVAGSKI